MDLNFGEIFLWEVLGTGTLILLGAGVVANAVLKKTLAFGKGGDWVLITLGWGFAVFAGASIAEPSGGHINPAVTLGSAITGGTAWSDVPAYVLGQMVGAIIGATLAWAAYKMQFDTHDEPENTRGIFCTGPTVPNPVWNTVTEVIATFVLVFWILAAGVSQYEPLGYAAVAFIVLVIGTSLGGPTGYAINPARDLGPRIAYALLPIRGKGSPEWNYAWVPVVGPLLGSTLAALLYLAMPVAA